MRTLQNAAVLNNMGKIKIFIPKWAVLFQGIKYEHLFVDSVNSTKLTISLLLHRLYTGSGRIDRGGRNMYKYLCYDYL